MAMENIFDASVKENTRLKSATLKKAIFQISNVRDSFRILEYYRKSKIHSLATSQINFSTQIIADEPLLLDSVSTIIAAL